MDLKAEYLDLRPQMLEAIDQALTSMQLFLGPNVQALEQEFAAFCGVPHAIGCASGTDACQIALQAAGIGPGDEVITVAWTFIATLAAILHLGAQPVLVDIEPTHFNLDPALVEAAITPRTKALMPVHIYGYPVNMPALQEIADRHGLLIIEDACQAHGATLNGRAVGSLGAAAAFSFYLSKNLGCYGEGGMITTASDAIAEQCRLLRNHGYTGKYDHGVIGYNSRLDEIQAAILRIKLARLEDSLAKRRQQAELYRARLADTPLIVPPEEPGYRHCYYMFHVRAARRDELAAFLSERGIGTAQHYVHPAHHQPALAPYGLNEVSLPVTDQASREILILPCHPYLTLEQIEYVADSIVEFYSKTG
jgi:dTDP-4-amino-4,6-dideoxygalactose transaminase